MPRAKPLIFASELMSWTEHLALELAHAYLPYSNSEGLAGDLHFDRDENWGQGNGGFFLETALHEIGHCLGLDHEDDVDAIMNPFIMNRFGGLGQAYLLQDDIDGIQFIYGSGVGSVMPLDEDDVDQPDDQDEEPDDGGPGDPEPGTNDIVAELDTDNGELTLQGDAEDNTLLVCNSWWFTVVMGYEGTTINGQNAVAWCHLGNVSLNITAGAGNDGIYLWGARGIGLRGFGFR